MKSPNLQYLTFEVDGTALAIDLSELAAAAGSCPSATYPGLPEYVKGIVQWGGKVFPVVKIWDALHLKDVQNDAYVFTVPNLEGPFQEIAIQIPEDVRMMAPVEHRAPGRNMPAFVKSIVKDSEGYEAHLINLHAYMKAA